MEAILEIPIKQVVVKNPEAKTKIEQWLWLLAGREEKLEIAKKLLKLGISIDKIEEATELTKEEIEEL